MARAKHTVINIARYMWPRTWLPYGLGARRMAAGIMLILSGGRLGIYSSHMQSDWLSMEQYGIMLLLTGCALWHNGRFRLSIYGRSVAVLGALLMATMAFDVGAVNVTSLVEMWVAVILAREVFTSNDC